MKTNVSTALVSYLAKISEQQGPNTIFCADLYTITLLGGQVVNLCSGPVDITYNSVTYQTVEPAMTLDRSRVKQSVGMTVDSVKITLRALPSAQPVASIPLLQEITQGYWDQATVLVQRLFGLFWGDTSLGTVIWWKGQVGNISELDRSHVVIEVPSKLELLNQPLPKNLFQTTCRHVLGDVGCTINLPSLAVAGAVQSGSNASAIVTNLTQPANFAGPTAAPTTTTYKPTPGPNLPERTLFVVQTYVSALGESLVGPEIAASFGAITNGYVSSPGYGYTPNATLTLGFSGGGGSGAAGTVTVNAIGQLNVVNITAIGSGYTSPPTVTVSGGGGTGGQVTAIIAGIPGDVLLVVNAPASIAGATGWNCYIGYASGAEYLQTAIPLNFSGTDSNFLEPITGIVQGNTPPLYATNGYFAQGVITFTSGVLNGLSRLVQTYTNNGSNNVCNVIPPFPQAPSPGDTFSVVPGCDRRSSTCESKFGNLIHFGGQPFIPVPESSV